MPTPRDSTDELPLHSERSHTTCPPEDDRPGQWRVEVLDHLSRGVLDNALSDGTPLHSEKRPDEVDSPGTMDISNDTAPDRAIGQTSIPDSAGSSPLNVAESLLSSHTDDQEIRPPGSTSSALDLYYSIRYGIESSRVRYTCNICKRGIELTLYSVNPNAHIVYAPHR